MASYSGIFVAIEGIDGSGKTTQIPLVRSALEKLGYGVYTTSEPSSGKLGPILRQYLSDQNSKSEVDALLFAADRVEHYYGEILPELKKGKVVITDRYKMSSIIYQGSGGLDEDWIITINNRVPDPDLTLLLDLSAETALQRVSKDRDHLEKFETLEMLKKLLERYHSIDMKSKLLINAEQTINDLTDEIVDIIVSHFNHS